jgi:hypothetical protein
MRGGDAIDMNEVYQGGRLASGVSSARSASLVLTRTRAITCAASHENTPPHVTTTTTPQRSVPPVDASPSSGILARVAHLLCRCSSIAQSDGRCAVPSLSGRARSTLNSYLRLRDNHGLDSFSPHLRRSGYRHHHGEHDQSSKMELFIASLKT